MLFLMFYAVIRTCRTLSISCFHRWLRQPLTTPNSCIGASRCQLSANSRMTTRRLHSFAKNFVISRTNFTLLAFVTPQCPSGAFVSDKFCNFFVWNLFPDLSWNLFLNNNFFVIITFFTRSNMYTGVLLKCIQCNRLLRINQQCT